MSDNTKLVPEIRFKGYTDAWEQRKLGEIGKATGGTSIESQFVEDGKYKVISIGSYSEQSKYTDQGLRTNANIKTSSRILKKDDLTMILNDKTNTGRIIGRVLLIDEDDAYIYNQRTQRIEIFKELFDSQFMYQFLNADNNRDKVVRSAQGNTQIYVNWSAICELEYLMPVEKSEQTAIGEFFRTLDAAIALHQRKLDGLRELKKGYLQQMFPQAGERVPRVRFAGFSGEWVERRLGDVVERIIRKNTNLESTLPLTISAQFGLIDQNEFFDKQVASKDVSGYYLLKKGDFAYNKSYSNGYPWGAVKRLDRYEKGVLSTNSCTNRRQDDCAMISHKITPGTTGFPGKCPSKKNSSPLT